MRCCDMDETNANAKDTVRVAMGMYRNGYELLEFRHLYEWRVSLHDRITAVGC